MIKTINLKNSEVKVEKLGGDNTEILNNSGGTVYASKLPNITVGGDEVIAIPPGAIDGLYGTHETVYLLGTGSVEVRGVDREINTVRCGTASGGLEIFSEYVDEKCSETLDSAKEYADSLHAELARYIGYADNDVYGLEADFENCVFTRLAGAVGKTAGADFDSVNAYGGRRRCNLSDDGEVLAYYGDEDFKADGSNGQVMVEQPKFYYRVVPLKTEKIDGADGYHLRKARYYISDTPKSGFKVHPAFVRNGVEADRIYLSAFEGSIYDTSAGEYLLNDEQIADFDNDKLSSIAGAKPCSGLTQALTRSNARLLAHNRGSGWEQSYMATVSATELLLAIEYATFNIQTILGTGNTVQSSVTLNTQNTGKTECLGNVSGAVFDDDSISFIAYRGEENFYGNIWAWVDGGNNFNATSISNYGEIYVADHGFMDNINSMSYKDTGIRPCSVKGYISAFGYSEEFDWLFVATECKGNDSVPIGDCLWNDLPGWRTAAFGGCRNYGESAGAFCWTLNNSSTVHNQIIGARLVYFSVSAI